MNALAIAQSLMRESVTWNSSLNPFKAHVEEGMPHLVVVAGDNGSGKSYFVEWMRGWGRKHHDLQETICISIRVRTGSGLGDMSGMRKSMIFGQEDEQSTGETSVAVALRALHNMAGREESGYRCLMILDEPEIGLSGAYSRAFGEPIAEKLSAIACKSTSLVVVTHSRAFVTGLMEKLGGKPSFVYMGADAPTLDQWLQGDGQRSVDDLLALSTKCRDQRRQVDAMESEARQAA